MPVTSIIRVQLRPAGYALAALVVAAVVGACGAAQAAEPPVVLGPPGPDVVTVTATASVPGPTVVRTAPARAVEVRVTLSPSPATVTAPAPPRATVTVPGPVVTVTEPPLVYPACLDEDGTNGSVTPCLWDAQRMGNGQGVGPAYIALAPGGPYIDLIPPPAP